MPYLGVGPDGQTHVLGVIHRVLLLLAQLRIRLLRRIRIRIYQEDAMVILRLLIYKSSMHALTSILSTEV